MGDGVAMQGAIAMAGIWRGKSVRGERFLVRTVV